MTWCSMVHGSAHAHQVNRRYVACQSDSDLFSDEDRTTFVVRFSG